MNKILFYASLFLVLMIRPVCSQNTGYIMTVNGPVSSSRMGISLIHEHILVDFIGAASYSSDRWDTQTVYESTLPFLEKIEKYNCRTLVECTPSFLGKDPLLLKRLSDKTGMHILTNTGYYGAGNDKYIPTFALSETADELAQRWIEEWENGIEGTAIKPGFIKIGVDGGALSPMHTKLIRAAARTHLQSGLVIASHTGPAVPAFEQIAILQEEGVSPEAFIWTHAQGGSKEEHIKAAQYGAWISLDGLHDNNIQEYVDMIRHLKEQHLLHKILLSHDAGWYDPEKENGGTFRGFTTLFEKLVPALKGIQFTEKEINQLLVLNPAKAFEIQVRKTNTRPLQ